MPRLPGSGLAFALAPVLLGGCAALVPVPRAAFQDGVERIPGPSHVVLVGLPERAPRDLVIAFGDGEGNVFDEQRATIRAGDVIRATSISLPSRHNVVVVDGQPCLGWFDFAVESTTTVQLRLTDDGCEISTLGVKPDA